jgi:hypothetical protein
MTEDGACRNARTVLVKLTQDNPGSVRLQPHVKVKDEETRRIGPDWVFVFCGGIGWYIEERDSGPLEPRSVLSIVL